MKIYTFFGLIISAYLSSSCATSAIVDAHPPSRPVAVCECQFTLSSNLNERYDQLNEVYGGRVLSAHEVWSKARLEALMWQAVENLQRND